MGDPVMDVVDRVREEIEGCPVRSENNEVLDVFMVAFHVSIDDVGKTGPILVLPVRRIG